MSRYVTSKNMDGITDLVVLAPIREGFIQAYENVTYATRLRIVAEALNRVRVAAREHETITPFSDVTERILTLLDFRVGVIDKDLFALEPEGRPEVGGTADAAKALRSRRFLYLTATFDGAWEPYMRLIWNPLGAFLDLLFCNCDGYVTATEHSYDEYAQWVRDNQVNSAIFYAATGLTVRDNLYLNRLEHVLRARPSAEAGLEIARMTMPKPEMAALAERALAARDPAQAGKIHELALEALTVLYRLADYYPPGWMAGHSLSEGHYLMRAADALLLGWERLIPRAPLPESWKIVERVYADPLSWYRSGVAHLRALEAERALQRPKDPPFDKSEIQGGIWKPQGSLDAPMRQGALLLMTIVDADAARSFLRQLESDGDIHFQEGAGDKPDVFFRTVALTADGLRRLGVEDDVLDWFPKEFREGMEARSGLVGDMRENHPRRWTLPERNWPPFAPDADPAARPRPRIDTTEIDIVLQVRTASTDGKALLDEIARLATAAGDGLTLQGYEPMCASYDAKGLLVDYFGFHDGVSQPKPVADLPDDPPPDPTGPVHKDEVRLGEILLGYRNDRDDFAPVDFVSPGHEDWRKKDRREALGYQFNGTFMVIRKLQQEVEAFATLISNETARINSDHPGLVPPMTEDRLKARMLGRHPDGRPLFDTGSDDDRNNFNFEQDKDGATCPFASHIRRTNPREPFQGRNAPRLIRRGMSFDHSEGGGGRGLMFMAYNASIAEQFETIQRWINGGNSTYIASGHNDPLLGVAPKTGALHEAARVFRFVEGDEVIRVTMPKPFVSLHWGLYLFVPSRTALRKLCALTGHYEPFRTMLETHGQAAIARLRSLKNAQTKSGEWKRLLEDFDAKDPSEGDITPHVWSAIRWYYGGSFKIPPGTPLTSSWDDPPDEDRQPLVLAASYSHVMRVLSDWNLFSTEEQLRRIAPAGIPIFVAQQPDDQYKNQSLRGRFNYRQESEATNEILMSYGEESGFKAGYAAGKQILDTAKEIASQAGRGYFKLELRRQFLLPALGGLCRIWYGLPDGETFHFGGWTWQPPAERDPPGPRCPGDFLSPSRHTFYPRPTQMVKAFAEQHGAAVHQGSVDFVKKHRSTPFPPGVATIARRMFDALPDDPQGNDVLARNLVGTMIGAIPPMDGNLRGVLLEWLDQRTLWRHQAALRRALGDRPAITDFEKARAVLYGPVSRAMCKRPAPDLVYRTALGPTKLEAGDGYRDRTYGPECDVQINERDQVVVSLVSASQRSLKYHPDGDVSIVFGGKRRDAYQSDASDIEHPVHACPARAMAMGAIMGILAALLDAGRIQALPASLIVRINDWK